MKILFLLNTLASGGAERVTSSLANDWAKNGHNVAIATMGADSDFYPLDARIERHRFNLSAPSSSIPSAIVAASKRICACRRLLRRHKPDVAIAMMTSWNVELALAGFGLPVRKIGSERIHPPALPLGPIWEFLRKWTYGLLDVVVAQTAKSRDWIVHHTSARDVVVIGNPLAALEAEPPAVSPRIPAEAPVVLGVGRLVRQKRFDRLISAFAANIAENPAWHLAIVGSGDALAGLKEQAEKSGVSDRIHFIGATASVGAWYARASAFVLSSDFEGFPNVLLEAMSCGLACVSTDCDTGPDDLINSEVNGLLVANNDQRALDAALGRLMGDPLLRRRLGQSARNTATVYSCDAISSRWEHLFHGQNKGAR